VGGCLESSNIELKDAVKFQSKAFRNPVHGFQKLSNIELGVTAKIAVGKWCCLIRDSGIVKDKIEGGCEDFCWRAGVAH
jgi:hypothetical protein